MLTLKEQTMLGNIPTDWDSKSLRSLLHEHCAGDWGDDAGPNMVKVLRSTNLTNDGRLDLDDIALRALPQRTVDLLAPKQHDILLERSGGGPGQPVGRVGFIEVDMPAHAFSNFLHLLRPNREAINPRLLAWLLYRVNRTGRIVRLEQQTTQMRNLNFRDYLTMPLPVPSSPDEQAAIARVLDAVNTVLDRTRTAIARARSAKKSFAQELFTKGTRGEPQRKTVVGYIPRSWEVVSVESVVREFQYGLSVPMQLKGAMPILRMGNIQGGDVVLNELKYVSLPDRVIAPYIVKRGDVLFNRTNSQEWVGKVGVYRLDTPIVFASYLIRVVPTPQLADNYFLGQLLDSYPIQCRIKRYATPGVQQVNINATNLGKVLIPLPAGATSLDEQREIAAILEDADAVIRSYEPMLAAQQALKRSLMYDLLTGRVRVPAVKLETVLRA